LTCLCAIDPERVSAKIICGYGRITPHNFLRLIKLTKKEIKKMKFRTFTLRILFVILSLFALPILASAQSGYVWANEPATASYIPSTTYSFNSSGGAIKITRSGVGTYSVRFAGLNAVSGGNVLVTAYGSGSETCKVVSWNHIGDFLADVRCFNHLGNPVDTMYTVRVGVNNAAFGKNGYAWANNPASASYTPDATYSFNSSGGAISITRSGIGNYAVQFAGLGGGTVGGNVLVTAYGSGSETCKVASWNFAAGVNFVANVRCFTAAGVAVDTRYTINIVR